MPFSPTQVAALQRGLVCGVGNGQLAEVSAALNLAEQFIGSLQNSISFSHAAATGNRQQDVTNIDIWRGHKAALFRAEEVIQLLTADIDTAHHIALLYPGQDHLVANLLANC